MFMQLLIIASGVVLAIFGLTYFALRRREEILEDYLAPKSENLEEEFFRRLAERRVADEKKKTASEAPPPQSEEAQWGDE